MPAPPGVGPARDSYVGTRLIAGQSAVGVQMDITTESLVMRPIATEQPRRLLTRVLPAVGVPGTVVRAANMGLDATGLLEPKVIPLNTIESVTPLPTHGRLQPPAARVTLQNGEQHDVGVLKSQLTPSFSSANQEQRDRLLAAFHSARPPEA